MKVNFQVAWPDGTVHDLVMFMTMLACNNEERAYNEIAGKVMSGHLVSPEPFAHLDVIAYLKKTAPYVSVTISGAGNNHTAIISPSSTPADVCDTLRGQIALFPSTADVLDLHIHFSNTPFVANSQPVGTTTVVAPSVTESLAPVFKVIEESLFEIAALPGAEEAITLPPLSAVKPKIDLLDDVLKDAPPEVRAKMAPPKEKYLNFMNILETIRTNPGADRTLKPSPIQDLVDYLYPTSPGDVTADGALNLASEAIHHIMTIPGIYITESSKLTYASLFNDKGGFELGFVDRGYNCRYKPKVELDCRKGNLKIRIPSHVGMESEDGNDKLDPIVETVLQKMFSKLMTTDGLLDILTLYVGHAGGTGVESQLRDVRCVLKAALETRVLPAGSSRLEERVFCWGDAPNIALTVQSNIQKLLQNEPLYLTSMQYALNLRLSPALGTVIRPSLAPKMIGVMASLMTDVLLRAHPVITTMLYRIYSNMSIACAQSTSVAYITPSISPFCPHAVTTYKIKKKSVTIAHPLSGQGSLLTKTAVAKRRAADIVNIIGDPEFAAEHGFPANIKSLFILPDPQIYRNTHICPSLITVKDTMVIERAFKASLQLLIDAGSYVIANRKPLEQAEVIGEETALFQDTIYMTEFTRRYQYLRRSSGTRTMAQIPIAGRGTPPILAGKIDALNRELSRKPHKMRECLDTMDGRVESRREFSGAHPQVPSVPLNRIVMVKHGLYSLSSGVNLSAGASISDLNSMLWNSPNDDIPLYPAVNSAALTAIGEMSTNKNYKMAFVLRIEGYYGRAAQCTDRSTLQRSLAIDDVEPKTQFEIQMKGVRWYELDKIMNARSLLSQNDDRPQFAYAVLGQTPDISKILYTTFSLYNPDAFSYSYLWMVLLSELTSLNALMMPIAVAASAATPAEPDVIYIPDEYSKHYREAKKQRAEQERKRVMADLRRIREDYATHFRNKIPHVRRRHSDAVKVGANGSTTLPEELILKDSVDRGEIEGFRAVDGAIILKTPEVNILESGLIFNIGKFAVSIRGFDGASHVEFRFYNLNQNSWNSQDRRVYDHPHVRDSKACLGNMEAMLSNAVQNDDLATAVQLCKGYLNAVDSRDTFGHYIFTKWPFVLPTVHNHIKFGTISQMNPKTPIMLYNSGPEAQVLMASYVTYDAIKAEYLAQRASIEDDSRRKSDYQVKFSALPASMRTYIGENLYSEIKASKYKDRVALTSRTDKEILRSLTDFERMIASEDAWNKVSQPKVGKKKTVDAAAALVEPPWAQPAAPPAGLTQLTAEALTATFEAVRNEPDTF